jgi:hypothetical protein
MVGVKKCENSNFFSSIKIGKFNIRVFRKPTFIKGLKFNSETMSKQMIQ